jgi:hypothetical protein
MARNSLPFIRTVWRSSTSPAFYGELRSVSGWSTARYLALLVLIVALGILAMVGFFIATINAPVVIRQGYDAVLAQYPSNLAVTLSSTGVSVNQELPYAIAMPRGMEEQQDSGTAALLVFVEEDAVSFKNFEDYNAFVVLSPTEMYTRQDDNRVTAHDIGGMLRDLDEPVVINQELIRSVPIEDITSFWMLQPAFYVPVAILLLMIVLYPALLLLTAITVLLWSLVLWVLLQFFARTRGVRFGKVYQMGLHAYTPIFVLGYLTSELQGLLAFVAFQFFAAAMIVHGYSHAPTVVPAKPAKTQATTAIAKRPTKKLATRAKTPSGNTAAKRAPKSRRKQ